MIKKRKESKEKERIQRRGKNSEKRKESKEENLIMKTKKKKKLKTSNLLIT